MLLLPGPRGVCQGTDTKPDKGPRHSESKEAAHTIEQAEQAEAEGDFAGALQIYTRLMKAKPRWAAVQLRIAACQVALERKKQAITILREVLKMKSASAELLSQARASLQELLLPKLSDGQRKDWKLALALIQAGEELKQHESEDLEIRIQNKLHAKPYQEAIELLTTLTRDLPDYAPAHLSLGVSHESLSNFKEAAEGYRRFLEFGIKNELPELEQQAQIRQRLLVCERRHQVDVDLAKRIPGLWEASYDYGEERKTTTTQTSEKTSTTVTEPAFAFGGQMELLPGGGVNRREGSASRLDKDTYWKVVGKQLIVGGDVGKPSEWCNLGPLVPSGNRFEGVTMDLHRTRYVRKGDLVRESPNKPLRASADTASALGLLTVEQ
jgi:tetratricopeptide (TPR) repeat protein